MISSWEECSYHTAKGQIKRAVPAIPPAIVRPLTAVELLDIASPEYTLRNECAARRAVASRSSKRQNPFAWQCHLNPSKPPPPSLSPHPPSFPPTPTTAWVYITIKGSQGANCGSDSSVEQQMLLKLDKSVRCNSLASCGLGV